MNPPPAGSHSPSPPDDRPSSPFANALPPPPQVVFTNGPRRLQHPAPAVYPLLLLASTALAGVFCYLYISKPITLSPATVPVAVARPQPPAVAGTPAAIARSTPVTKPTGLVPNADQLPGDRLSPPPSVRPGQVSPRRAIPSGSPTAAFEETNLRIQHILTAETPAGDLSRIVLDVPVLYQTGTLAWTQTEVAEARELLKRLNDYQEQSRLLRDEGNRLLTSWNRLVGRTTPALVLRADSPALPGNQQAGDATPQPATLDTSESIQLQPTGP